MRIARVIGTLTATVKDAGLGGQKLLVVDVVDAAGAVIERGLVVTDVCGAGVGEAVLVAMGSAARLPAGTAGLATDATAIAIIDEISLPAGQPSST